MRAIAIVLVCLALAVCAKAGDNPDINILLEFQNGENYIEPTPNSMLTVTIYLENFGSGGGTSGVEFMLVRTFPAVVLSASALPSGWFTLGDPETGWAMAGSCAMPDGNGRVAVAEVTYWYTGGAGTIEIVDNPLGARVVVDCGVGDDEWCVRLSPSGNGGVYATPPAGDCPSGYPCIQVTKNVDCDISKVGDEVTYTICVENCGDDALYNLEVLDDVLGDLSPFFPSEILAGQMACYDFPYAIQPGDDNGLDYPDATHTNTVTVTAETSGGDPAPPGFASETVYLVHPGVDVDVECTTPHVPTGDDAEFEVAITNVGDIDLDIATSDPRIPPLTLDPYETYVAVVAESCVGASVNYGINVTATIPPTYCELPNEYYAYDYAECSCGMPCILVWKDVGCEYSKVGDDVLYMICIENCGDSELYNILVQDDLLGDLSPFFADELGPYDVDCFDFFYTVQPGDDTGEPGATLVSAVTASGEDIYGSVVVNVDEAVVTLLHPGISATKTCLTPWILPGDDAEFEITITNEGDCDLVITTNEPEIPGPFTLFPGESFVSPPIVRTDPGGVDCVYNDVTVTATIPPEYCNLPNVYYATAEDCCGVLSLPVILGVLDVGNDQGRLVRLRWQKSPHDTPGAGFTIDSYEVYRRQDAYRVDEPDQPSPEPTVESVSSRGRIDGWDYVASIPAHGDDVYQYLAPTLCDSTADGGICWSVFMIRATTPNPYVYFDSAPDSGYSVDNLAPAPPAGLLADGDESLVLLTWEPSEEEDFDHYAIYRDVVEGFEPGEPIGYTSDPTFEDGEPPAALEWWYKVTAFDFGGNESEPSEAAAAVSSGASDVLPTRFWLGPPIPSPFAGTTDIQYRVPAGCEDCRVTITVYDARGRVVRRLVDGEIQPGSHTVMWDGKEDSGSPAASGIYFYSMEAGDYSSKRKMVLLR